ncbi:MAG: hypothetical protein LIO75_09655, partial [Lachnospiraceae bacterium]|nr:hypothetical protein [Lachnospiraceae bacterium]
VYNSGTFSMEGGEISNNRNTMGETMYGSGTVYMKDGTFEMTGGSISGNKTNLLGGGFYIAGGTVTINGEEAEISGNQAVDTASNQPADKSIGGGIYMCGGELIILNGSIVNNEAYHIGNDNSDDNPVKYAALDGVYSTDGVYTESPTLGTLGGSGGDYGLGGGIFVDSGTLIISDGAVIQGNYSPFASTSGIVIANDMFTNNDEEASQIYLSGSPQISDTIWLDEGKSILINGALGGGDETYQVYQQETDFRLVENGGTAAARYTDESYMNADDGDKFTVYPYDAEWDYKADTMLDRYTALNSAVTGSSAGIYANYAPVDISEITYEFTDAYSTDEETGTAQYKYYGKTVSPTIAATAQIGEDDDAASVDVTNYLDFTVADHDGSVGDVTVTVTVSSSTSYHFTDESGEGYELTFTIIPFDIANTDEDNRYEDVSFTAEDVAYDTAYPEGTLTETMVTGQARLNSVSWTDLVQADSADSETGDYYVTYENNDQAGTATAVIHGINNYTGEYSVTFEITETEEDDTDDGSGTGTGDETDETGGKDTFLIRRGTIYYFFFTLKDGNADYRTVFGEEDDQVLIGDWDGDGLDSVCVRRGNVYYFTNSIDTMEVELVVTYGRADDEVLVGDWDGDGKDSLAMRRKGTIYYFTNDIENPDGENSTWRTTYGRTDDEVLVGDWENKGYDSLGVRRNGKNIYYFSLSMVTEPNSDVWRTTYGRADDQVLVGDWDGDGKDSLAMRRKGIYYYTTNDITDPDGTVDRFVFGRVDDEVYAGTWK